MPCNIYLFWPLTWAQKIPGNICALSPKLSRKSFSPQKKEDGNGVLLATCNEYQQIFMSHTCLTRMLSLSIPLWPSLSRFLSGFSLVFPPYGEEVANTPTVHDRDND